MAHFPVHFAESHDEPFPPLTELPTIEANPTQVADLVEALKAKLAQGHVPQNRLLRWARVVLNTHANGNRGKCTACRLSRTERFRLIRCTGATS